MTIRNHADVRRCMLYIHSHRVKTGDQRYMIESEDRIATEPRCVDWELQAIERATTLEEVCGPGANRSIVADRVREILEGE